MKYLSFMILSFCPLWASAAAVTMSYQNGTTSFASGSNGTANYLVRADSAVPFPITLSYQTGNYPWATQVTTGTSACAGAAVCSSHFTLSPGGSCCLMLNLNGSGLSAGNYSLSPVVATTPATYKYTVLSPTPVIVIPLQVSPSLLGLSVNDPTTIPPLTGNPRSFTITNSGPYTVTGLTVGPPAPALPTGSSVIGDTCTGTSLEPGGTCTLTIRPGSNASNGASGASCATGIAPIPSVFSISASNAATVSTASVDVLSYQCIYQGGYIYSVDDTTSKTGSIGGKVAALENQAAALWSSDGAGNPSFNAIYGISEISTTGTANPSQVTIPPSAPGQPITGQVACNGKTDGACDTNNIVTYYNANRAAGGEAPTPLTQYASGLCKASIGGYTDWYLPAICEMGPVSNGSGCVSGTPNMVTNLSSLLLNSCTGTSCLNGVYWSSTEYSGQPDGFVWYQDFEPGFSNQGFVIKGFLLPNTLAVRCSRALTR